MARRIRSVGILALVSLIALFALTPLAGAAPRAAETKTVTIKDFEFAPKELTINVGDTVKWENDGPSTHSATSTNGVFDSGAIAAGEDFSFTFTTAGTFNYACKFHDIMQGTNTVGAAAPAPAAAPAAQPTVAVDAGDQPVVDGAITVASVTAGQDGWIAAHLDENGAPGKVLGQTAVKTGDNKDVKIKLSEDVPVGGKLWPMLHIDAGTIGTYEFPGADVPVKDAAGNIVMKQITVTAAGGAPAAEAKDAVEVDNQAIKNNSITIEEVYASKDGWIVAHLDENGAPGKVLGHTAVKAGESKDVVITLSEGVPVGGKLWPMLHIDVGTFGTYEFPGADVPVKDAAGNIVMKQITVTAAPAGLPKTGGEDNSLALIFSALVLLIAGGLLMRRMRRV